MKRHVYSEIAEEQRHGQRDKHSLEETQFAEEEGLVWEIFRERRSLRSKKVSSQS